MKRRLSLRWRLILLSWSLAFTMALVLVVLYHMRTQHQLLGQLEKTLETKCDEVITLLEAGTPHPNLEDFLKLETRYRFTAVTYFYRILDAHGEVFAQSANLGGRALPLPDHWNADAAGLAVRLATVPHPLQPDEERIRLRSERIDLSGDGRASETYVIQTAASLAPFESTVRGNLRDTTLVAAGGLAAAFVLLWFVTTWSLRPVTAMTRKASQITATDLHERLPLAERADELDELAGVLNNMLDRLAASLRQMEQFSSDAAHQLRTPLTRIRGELDLLLSSDVDEPGRGQLELIREEVERLSNLCGRLLLLARLDWQARGSGFLDERVHLGEVVSELLEQTAPLASDKGVHLRQGSISNLFVKGSRPLLVEALMNLLDNAIRCTHDGGSVVVSVDRRDDTACVSVEDSGPGIPPEERERVFRPFHRLRRESEGDDDGGVGLGLAITRAIALAHGGRVELLDAPGDGSLFRLVLPVPAAP